jgi:L-asparaginase II
MSEVLVRVMRGDHVENQHRGHIVITNSKGKIIYKVGDPDFLFCLRSCAKPLQALPVIETGAADRFAFNDEEIAAFCGSLNGQDYHVRVVESILSKIGLDSNYLQCGIHQPSHRGTAKKLISEGKRPLPIHNTCAGKHAAMLALCVFNAWPTANYCHIEHPVQQMILQKISQITEVPQDNIGVGIDGCGVPVFFLPLRQLALAYAKLTEPHSSKQQSKNSPVARMMQATLHHPEMIAGDERICTDIMKNLRDRVFAKTGADGGYALSIMDKGFGIGVKVEDGNYRALHSVVIEILDQLGLLHEKERRNLARYHHPAILNYQREEVGVLKPVFQLEKVKN